MSSSVIFNSAPLHETISRAEALKLAKHVSGQRAQLVSYQLRPCSVDRIGNQHQLLLEIQSDESSVVEQYSLLVKTILQRNSVATVSTNEKHAIQQESTFFRDIVPQLMKHVDVGRWIPKCFLAKSDALVLEDLAMRGYSTRGCVFDEETTRSALRSVARLQASSILAEARLEKSLRDLYPSAFREMMSFADRGEKSQGWFSTAIDTAVKVADNLGLNSSKIPAVFDRLRQIVTEETESSSDRQRKWKVVSHGALWASNMMFDVDEPPNCVLVNFQSPRYASPAQDVLLLLHLCTSGEFRRQHEAQLIEFYHSTLRTLAYKYNPAARVLSIDQLKCEIERERLRAIVSATIYLPIAMLDKRFAADVLDDLDEYEEFRCRDRAQKVIELMQRDSVYRQRLQESVRELVDYSEQYF